MRYHRLGLQALKRRRTTLRSQANRLRRKIYNNQIATRNMKEELEQTQGLINTFAEKQLIELESRRMSEAETKATRFLIELIGTENYEQLLKDDWFTFWGSDHQRYRLNKKGKLQVVEKGYWYNVCVLRPTSLPLPDVLASIFTTLTKDSFELMQDAIKRKTKEEVIT